MDIYSRKIVGWQVYENESSAQAADLMTDICQREGIKPNQVTLHSDNGSPMKGATMASDTATARRSFLRLADRQSAMIIPIQNLFFAH